MGRIKAGDTVKVLDVISTRARQTENMIGNAFEVDHVKGRIFNINGMYFTRSEVEKVDQEAEEREEIKVGDWVNHLPTSGVFQVQDISQGGNLLLVDDEWTSRYEFSKIHKGDEEDTVGLISDPPKKLYWHGHGWIEQRNFPEYRWDKNVDHDGGCIIDPDNQAMLEADNRPLSAAEQRYQYTRPQTNEEREHDRLAALEQRKEQHAAVLCMEPNSHKMLLGNN